MSGKDYECHLTVFASIFYRCVENISFRGHVLALNFGQYNQHKPLKKRPENVNFWKILLEEVTMVVKEKFFKEAETIFRQEVAPTGARNAPISQCNSYTSFRCHGNSIS